MRATRSRAIRRRPGPDAPAQARNSPAFTCSARRCPSRYPPASAPCSPTRPPCSSAGATAFRARCHRFLAAVRQAPDRLAGIVEADETFVLESRKGERKLDRKPRRRGGKARKRGLSREQVPILVAADRAGATLSHTLPVLNAKSVKEALEPVVARDALLVSDANRCYPPVAAALDIPHESINGAAGERVRGALHIQTVNTRHSQIKGFLRGFRGIATKYLDSYLRWFHLIELGDQPSPRACLEAAMARPCIRCLIEPFPNLTVGSGTGYYCRTDQTYLTNSLPVALSISHHALYD